MCDSIFKTVDRETIMVIYGLFKSLLVNNVKVVKSQKLKGVKDYGLLFCTCPWTKFFKSKISATFDKIPPCVTCFQKEKLVPFF